MHCESTQVCNLHENCWGDNRLSPQIELSSHFSCHFGRLHRQNQVGTHLASMWPTLLYCSCGLKLLVYWPSEPKKHWDRRTSSSIGVEAVISQLECHPEILRNPWHRLFTVSRKYLSHSVILPPRLKTLSWRTQASDTRMPTSTTCALVAS